MTYIKKIYIEGFKSFAKPSNIVLNRGFNVVVGPNGSGKSNIADAICFVLGRLKIRSMRAAKAANLIYHGGKEKKPSSHAKVSMVFDNSDSVFSVPEQEVEITRMVKKDGSSIYKINSKTTTRQEVLELLAQANIDPEGFNIIMQAEINNIIRMHGEEKRQIIEEIAGISIYEDRKEKSLRELQKTDERLKDVKTILNERTAYMRNLENEKAQAERYNKLKKDIEAEKASVLFQKIKEKSKNLEKIETSIKEKTGIIEKLRQKENDFKNKINEASVKIKDIEQEIQNKTGIEQDKLRNEILELKTELASLNVKKENSNDKLNNLNKRAEQLKEQLKTLHEEIGNIEKQARGYDKDEIEKDSSMIEGISDEIKYCRERISQIESERDEYNFAKLEISKKEFELNQNSEKLSDLRKNISDINENISALLKESPKTNIDEIKSKKEEHENRKNKLREEITNIEKEIFGLLTKKEIHEKDISEIVNLNLCPKCKQNVNDEHKKKLTKEIRDILSMIEKEMSDKSKSREKIEKEINKVVEQIALFIAHEKEHQKSTYINQQIKTKEDEIEILIKKESELASKISKLKEEASEFKRNIKDIETIEEKYSKEKTRLEKLQENLVKIKMNKPVLEERDYDIEITLKKQEMEKSDLIIKRSRQEKLGLESELKELIKKIHARQKELDEKDKRYSEIEKKFKDSIERKQKFQDSIHEYETMINEQQTSKILNESQFNDLKIEKARNEAEMGSFDAEFKSFSINESEIINARIEVIDARLKKHEEEFQNMGSVNLRALEVYDAIKKEYDEIALRVAKLEEEKAEILKVIEEIDKKKKQAFMSAFNAINEAFSRNFNELDLKGREVFLELENKDKPFDGGLDIIVKLGKGKYMDADSLSGGEKVIVALSLMFAIQKYKPYCFYIFDEIDPALDKRNSERFASILKNNVKSSQCLIITHNDAVINNAETIYGASMQDGVSRVISLKL